MGDNGEKQPPPPPQQQQEQQQLEGITEAHDNDVLCGRGGAALRHSGNQTYRKLVSLNKGLYITCLKTEKLKISRSIVAAIREKKGRFLEKDASTGTWYDIGDKKAVEKTSQALREGQPKLRQQIQEMGGGAAGAASLIESQFGAQAAATVQGVGLYPSDQMGGAGGRSILDPQSLQVRNGSIQQHMMSQQEYASMQQRQHQQQQQQHMTNMAFDDVQNDLMQRLSLHDDSDHIQQHQMRNNMGHQMNSRGAMMTNNGMGMPVGNSQMPLMSDFGGGPGMNQVGGVDDGTRGMTMDASFRAALQGMASPPGSNQGSLHSTQHTLDFYSMHSVDNMNGMSAHSSMGPPSSHLPTMSSISRQQQIDERFPLQQQSMGLEPRAISEPFQAQDSRSPQPPPQPQQSQELLHPGQRVLSMPPPRKAHVGVAGQPGRGYNGMAMPKGDGDNLDPVDTFGYPGQQHQQQARGGYATQQHQPQQQQQGRPIPGGYPGEQLSSGGYYGGQERGDSSARGFEEPVRAVSARQEDQRHGSQEDQRFMGPADRYNHPGQSRVTSSSTQGNPNVPVSSSVPTAGQPSVLAASSRHKMDRRNLFARMKFSKPPSYRDSKMTLGGTSTHSQVSSGDGMPDIHMVESQLSLHSTLSAMTDGNSTHLPNRSMRGSAWAEKAPAERVPIERAPVDKGGPMVERVPVVDHSARSGEYMDVLAMGSKHSLMSGLSKISDHSANDASIFSSLSKAIGNVSTRSIAMSEISVIDVAEREGEDDPSSNHEEEEPPTESQQG